MATTAVCIAGFSVYLTQTTEHLITANSVPINLNADKIATVHDNYFEQNIICNQLKEEIDQKLRAKNSPFGDAYLEQIFFSPQYDSCLYVERTDNELDAFQTLSNRRLFDMNDDSYSSRPITACLYFLNSNECRDLDEKIKKLKHPREYE